MIHHTLTEFRTHQGKVKSDNRPPLYLQATTAGLYIFFFSKDIFLSLLFRSRKIYLILFRKGTIHNDVTQNGHFWIPFPLCYTLSQQGRPLWKWRYKLITPQKGDFFTVCELNILNCNQQIGLLQKSDKFQSLFSFTSPSINWIEKGDTVIDNWIRNIESGENFSKNWVQFVYLLLH